MRALPLLLLLFAATPARAQAAARPDARVETALKSLRLRYTVEPDGDYALDIALPDDRAQTVWVRPETARFGRLDVREVFAIVHTPADSAAVLPVPNLAMRLLEENTDLVAGAWCVEDGGILFIVRLPADAPPAALRSAIDLAATAADALDDELHDGDDVW